MGKFKKARGGLSIKAYKRKQAQAWLESHGPLAWVFRAIGEAISHDRELEKRPAHDFEAGRRHGIEAATLDLSLSDPYGSYDCPDADEDGFYRDGYVYGYDQGLRA